MPPNIPTPVLRPAAVASFAIASRVQTFINVYNRLNTDKAFFGMVVKCLVNSAKQRKRDKLSDIY